MDVFEQVREVGRDASRADDDQVAVAREVLRNEVRGAKRRAGRGRSRRVGIGLGAAGAVGLAAAAGVVAVNLVGPPPHEIAPGDVAAAAEVLEEASATIIETSDPVLADGEYLKITETTDHLYSQDAAGGERSGRAAAEYRVEDIYYVPADRAGDWIVDGRDPGAVTDVYGPDGEEFGREVDDEYDIALDGDTVRALPGGRQGADGIGRSLERFAGQYDEMPRDPDALIEWLRDQIARTGGPNGAAADHVEEWMVAKLIIDALWLNLPPADVRSALFASLAEIDQYTLIDQGEGRASFETTNGRGQRTGFTISTDTGLITGVTTERMDGGDEIAPDVPELRVTMSQEVVDTAPEPTE